MRQRRLAALGAVTAAAAGALTVALHARAASSASVDLGEARRRLDEVYSRPPLDQLDQPRSQTLSDRLAQALGDLFGGASGAYRGLFLLMTAAAVGLLAWLLLRHLRALNARAEPRIDATEPAGGSDADAEWTAALAAADHGDHREAVRRAFRSALLAIARSGRLPVDAAWTTRELLARTRADADLLAALAPAAAAFDVAWYSGRPVTAADWQSQRARCEALRTMAGRQAPQPGVPSR